MFSKGIDSKFLNREIAKNNIDKIMKLSIISFISISVITLFTFIASLIGQVELSFSAYLPLLLMGIVNIIAFLFAKFYKFHYNEKTLKFIENIIFYYVTISLFGASFVMIVNYQFFNFSLLYPLIVFAAATFFVISPFMFTLPIMGTGLMVIFIMFNRGTNIDTVIIQGLFFVALILIGGMLSFSYNQFFIKTVKMKADLQMENYYRKQISKKLREANRKLTLQNSLDPLTGLQNRMAFNNYINTFNRYSTDEDAMVTASMIDIDSFKNYNDYYGHSKGDDVIAKVGAVILNISDKYGIFAARYGGEEFILLMHSQSALKVKTICEELIQNITDLNIPHERSDVDSIITVSIGAKSIQASSAKDILQAVEIADTLLYEVKRSGKNAYLLSAK